MNKWIGAIIAIAAGLIIGIIASRIIRAWLSKSKVGALRDSAGPLASLALSAGFIVGLLVALGFISPDDLEQLGSDTVAFLPKLISALVIFIGGNVAAAFAATAVAKSVAGSGAVARFAPVIARVSILAMAAIIAAGQLETDVGIVNIAASALLFSIGASVALLTGLGGRQVAAEIAAGRAWRRALEPGDYVRADGVAGRSIDGIVVDVHPTATEIDDDGVRVFVPNSKLLDAVVERRRPTPGTSEGELSR